MHSWGHTRRWQREMACVSGSSCRLPQLTCHDYIYQPSYYVSFSAQQGDFPTSLQPKVLPSTLIPPQNRIIWDSGQHINFWFIPSFSQTNIVTLIKFPSGTMPQNKTIFIPKDGEVFLRIARKIFDALVMKLGFNALQVTDSNRRGGHIAHLAMRFFFQTWLRIEISCFDIEFSSTFKRQSCIKTFVQMNLNRSGSRQMYCVRTDYNAAWQTVDGLRK